MSAATAVPPAPDERVRRDGAVAVGLIAVAVVLQVVVGRLGPSVAVPPLSPDQDSAPLADAWLVTLLLAVALAAGGAGTWLGLRAVRRGWRPAPARLLAGALLAGVVLLVGPPLGTADLGSYAAYGRMSVLDRNPYTTIPRQLQGDPVVDAAEAPWRDIPSIYGPVATAEFRVAAELGGTSREAVLRLLQCASGLAFAATALLLDRRARRGGPEARARTALLWAANPLLLHQLVAGGHLDSLVTLLVAGAVVVVLARPAAEPVTDTSSAEADSLVDTGTRGTVRTAASGFLFGLAGLVKATAAAPAAGLAVALALGGRSADHSDRRSNLRRTGLFLGAGLVVGVIGYLLAGGTTAASTTREASRMVTRGTPWRFVASGLEQLLPQQTARSVVGVLALAAALALAVRLHHALAGLDATMRCVLAASVAWLVLAPYSLPWYDAVAWALLALVLLRHPTVTGLEGWLLLHTAFLSVAYLPGRVVGLTDGLTTAQDVVRGALAPVVTLAVVAGLARLRPPADSVPPLS